MLPAKISSAVICLLICVGAFQPFCSFAGVMYRKDYVIKQDQGRQIWCEPYLVRKNDSLMKLFNEKGRIIDESPEEFLNIFKRLNPHITNLETIRPGQQIYIPLKKMEPGPDQEMPGRILTLPMITVSGEKTSGRIDHDPGPDVTTFTEYKIKPGDTLSQIIFQRFGIRSGAWFDAKWKQIRKINPELNNINRIYPGQILRLPAIQTVPNTDEDPISGPVEKISGLFNAKLLRKGNTYFPMPGRADFKLDMAQCPVMELPDGLRILFNPGNALAEDKQEIVHRFWPDTRIVNVSYDISVEGTLERILHVAPYLGDYLEKKGVMPDRLSLQLSSEMASLVEKRRYIPVYDLKQIVEVLMRLLSLSYTQNMAISFPYGGIQISSQCNRIESEHGRQILVDFGSFYGDAVHALEKVGFIVVQLQHTDDIRQGIPQLLNALGLSFSVNEELSIRNHKVRIPGIILKKGDRTIVITDSDLNDEMIQMVLDQGMVLLIKKNNRMTNEM